MYTAIKMNRVKKSIQKQLLSEKQQKLLKKPRKYQKKQTLPKKTSKKNQVL